MTEITDQQRRQIHQWLNARCVVEPENPSSDIASSPNTFRAWVPPEAIAILLASLSAIMVASFIGRLIRLPGFWHLLPIALFAGLLGGFAASNRLRMRIIPYVLGGATFGHVFGYSLHREPGLSSIFAPLFGAIGLWCAIRASGFLAGTISRPWYTSWEARTFLHGCMLVCFAIIIFCLIAYPFLWLSAWIGLSRLIVSIIPASVMFVVVTRHRLSRKPELPPVPESA